MEFKDYKVNENTHIKFKGFFMYLTSILVIEYTYSPYYHFV